MCGPKFCSMKIHGHLDDAARPGCARRAAPRRGEPARARTRLAQGGSADGPRFGAARPGEQRRVRIRPCHAT